MMSRNARNARYVPNFGRIALVALAIVVVGGLLWSCAGSSKKGGKLGGGGSPVEVTPDNFDSFVDGKDAVLMAYAPWCGHCKAMKPAYRAAARAHAKRGGRAAWGMCDCAAHPTLGQRLGVKAYPAVFRIRSGERTEYLGDRSEASLLAFAA